MISFRQSVMFPICKMDRLHGYIYLANHCAICVFNDEIPFKTPQKMKPKKKKKETRNKESFGI